MSPILKASDITWRAGGRSILGPLSLEVKEGELLTVIGPNGAGKTTLLRLLVGLLAPRDGALTWKGESYDRITRREMARRIAYVPQIRPLSVPLTVEQLALTGRYPYLERMRLAPAEADFAAVARALELANVRHLASRPLTELSGGERQAAYIAAALAQDTEVMILDEPTIHLDPRHQQRLATLLLELHRDLRRTVILATHDLHLAARLSTRVLALAGGRELACGPAGEILRPALLQRLFAAPFDLVQVEDGSTPLLVLKP